LTLLINYQNEAQRAAEWPDAALAEPRWCGPFCWLDGRSHRSGFRTASATGTRIGRSHGLLKRA
jgi:hypothetical protein